MFPVNLQGKDEDQWVEAAERGILVCSKEELGMDGPLRMWYQILGAFQASVSGTLVGVPVIGLNYLCDLFLPLRYFCCKCSKSS